MPNTISFEVAIPSYASTVAITPHINGERLPELVERFESANGFHVSKNGYGGIVPRRFRAYGPLEDYYLGRAKSDYWHGLGGIYLLGCTCGEVGCWPLVASIREGGDTIVWDNFRQPHRPKQDYAGFGPFVFAKDQYIAALQDMERNIALNA